jgi:uncharacterized protein YdeI (YjbR/CyaY-like superfamily)
MAKARNEVTWFQTPADWRAWLEANHATETELWVGLRKKHVPVGITWQQAVDEALCFGWIDGIANAVDADGYTCRITPRRPRSIWSAVNLKRIEQLIAEGRVHPAGLRVYQERDPSRSGLYATEQESVAFDPEQVATFAAHGPAWAWFQAQPPGYRHQATWWVVSAKRPETRARRLAQLIEDSASERRLKQFARG